MLEQHQLLLLVSCLSLGTKLSLDLLCTSFPVSNWRAKLELRDENLSPFS